MDVTPFIQTRSDQLNADDLMSGPIVVQILGASRGNADQPVSLKISGHQPWKPCKTMLRLLVFAWGADASQWVGRWAELYRDPKVKWGGVAVGGIRVSALSHIKPPLSVALTVTRGNKAMFKVKGLSSDPMTLEAVLVRNGLSRAVVDAYLASKGKPSLDERDENQQRDLAAWLDGHPVRVRAVKEAANG